MMDFKMLLSSLLSPNCLSYFESFFMILNVPWYFLQVMLVFNYV